MKKTDKILFSDYLFISIAIFNLEYHLLFYQEASSQKMPTSTPARLLQTTLQLFAIWRHLQKFANIFIAVCFEENSSKPWRRDTEKRKPVFKWPNPQKVRSLAYKEESFKWTGSKFSLKSRRNSILSKTSVYRCRRLLEDFWIVFLTLKGPLEFFKHRGTAYLSIVKDNDCFCPNHFTNECRFNLFSDVL